MSGKFADELSNLIHAKAPREQKTSETMEFIASHFEEIEEAMKGGVTRQEIVRLLESQGLNFDPENPEEKMTEKAVKAFKLRKFSVYLHRVRKQRGEAQEVPKTGAKKAATEQPTASPAVQRTAPAPDAQTPKQEPKSSSKFSNLAGANSFNKPPVHDISKDAQDLLSTERNDKDEQQ